VQKVLRVRGGDSGSWKRPRKEELKCFFLAKGRRCARRVRISIGAGILGKGSYFRVFLIIFTILCLDWSKLHVSICFPHCFIEFLGSIWWRIILFPFRVMNMVKLFKKAFWKFSLDIKIACYLDVKVHFSSSWKEEESWIQA